MRMEHLVCCCHFSKHFFPTQAVSFEYQILKVCPSGQWNRNVIWWMYLCWPLWLRRNNVLQWAPNQRRNKIVIENPSILIYILLFLQFAVVVHALSVGHIIVGEAGGLYYSITYWLTVVSELSVISPNQATLDDELTPVQCKIDQKAGIKIFYQD